MAFEWVCCAADCRTKVPSPKVCCGHHWFLLPPRVKSAVQLRIHSYKDRDAAAIFLKEWYQAERERARTA